MQYVERGNDTDLHEQGLTEIGGAVELTERTVVVPERRENHGAVVRRGLCSRIEAAEELHGSGPVAGARLDGGSVGDIELLVRLPRDRR